MKKIKEKKKNDNIHTLSHYVMLYIYMRLCRSIYIVSRSILDILYVIYIQR